MSISMIKQAPFLELLNMPKIIHTSWEECVGLVNVTVAFVSSSITPFTAFNVRSKTEYASRSSGA